MNQPAAPPTVPETSNEPESPTVFELPTGSETPAVAKKWISGFDAPGPLAEAARRALAQRLEAVEKALRPVRRLSPLEKQVHQLRVATRRASAALRAFEKCLKNNTRRRMDRRLKKIRDAAALVRAADVFLAGLRSQLPTATDVGRAALEHLMSITVSERDRLACDLAKPARKLTTAKFQRRTHDLLESIRDREEPLEDGSLEYPAVITFRAEAVSSLHISATELIDALAIPLDDPIALHAVRLLGKRLRYALEVFAACIDASIRDPLYGSLARLQERLGTINDGYESAERTARAAVQLRSALGGGENDRRPSHGLLAALERIQDEYRSAAERGHRKFFAWWQGEEAGRLRESIGRLMIGESQTCPETIKGEGQAELDPPLVVVTLTTISALAESVESIRGDA